MGDFVCLMKKSRIESGGDSGKIVMMNPPRGGLMPSRDSKGNGHCRHSAEWEQKLDVTPHHSSIIRRSFRA